MQFNDLLRASRNRPALVRNRYLNVLCILTKIRWLIVIYITDVFREERSTPRCCCASILVISMPAGIDRTAGSMCPMLLVNTDGPRITCALRLHSQPKSCQDLFRMATKTATTTQYFFRVARHTTYTRAALASYLECIIYACAVGFTWLGSPRDAGTAQALEYRGITARKMFKYNGASPISQNLFLPATLNFGGFWIGFTTTLKWPTNPPIHCSVLRETARRLEMHEFSNGALIKHYWPSSYFLPSQLGV